MIPRQQQDRNLRPGEAADSLREETLKSGRWFAAAESIATEKDKINLAGYRGFYDEIETAQKVEGAGVEAPGRVHPPVIFHAQM